MGDCPIGVRRRKSTFPWRTPRTPHGAAPSSFFGLRRPRQAAVIAHCHAAVDRRDACQIGECSFRFAEHGAKLLAKTSRRDDDPGFSGHAHPTPTGSSAGRGRPTVRKMPFDFPVLPGTAFTAAGPARPHDRGRRRTAGAPHCRQTFFVSLTCSASFRAASR